MEIMQPLTFSVVVSHNDNVPCLYLKPKKILMNSNNINMIKAVVTAAFREIPLIAYPTFKNKFQSLSSLCDKGIIYRKEDQYFFNI